MKNSWIKLYHEILLDPKMGKMNDHLFRRTIELFLLAGQEECDGVLPSIEDIAWLLRTNVPDIEKVIDTLRSLDIVQSTQDGELCVTNFYKRQNQNLSEAERSQRRRDNQKASRELSENDQKTSRALRDDRPENDQKTTGKRPENVTIDKEEDKEREKDKDKEEKREEREKTENVTQASRSLAKPTKHRYGNFQHVFLTDDEFQRLQDDIGQDKTTEYIQKLDDYLENNPKKSYANHNLTIRNWLNKDAKEPQTTFVTPEPKKTFDFNDVLEWRKQQRAQGVIDV